MCDEYLDYGPDYYDERDDLEEWERDRLCEDHAAEQEEYDGEYTDEQYENDDAEYDGYYE